MQVEITEQAWQDHENWLECVLNNIISDLCWFLHEILV